VDIQHRLRSDLDQVTAGKAQYQKQLAALDQQRAVLIDNLKGVLAVEKYLEETLKVIESPDVPVAEMSDEEIEALATDVNVTL